MVGEFELHLPSDVLLPLFDQIVFELLHPAAFDTDEVVVMVPAIEFEDGIAAFEMMTLDKPGGLELGQHPVNGGQTNFFPFVKEGLVDLFRGQMTIGGGAALEHLQNLYSGRSDF